jgi:hypothetical protein
METDKFVKSFYSLLYLANLNANLDAWPDINTREGDYREGNERAESVELIIPDLALLTGRAK